MSLLRAFALSLLLLGGAASQAQSEDFESFASGTVLSNQVAGLAFSNALVLGAGIDLNELEFPPASGTQVVVDNGAPLRLDFATPLASFSALFTYAVPLQLVALGAGDVELLVVNSRFASNLALSGEAGSTPNESLSLVLPSGFSALRVVGAPDGFSFAMDNLVLSAVPEPASALLLLVGMAGLMRTARGQAARELDHA